MGAKPLFLLPADHLRFLPKPGIKRYATFRHDRCSHVVERRPATVPQFKNIFPGFKIPDGSSVCFTERITASASAPCFCSRNSRLPIPTPCSPLHDPPNASARASIFLSRSHAHAPNAAARGRSARGVIYI